MLVIAGNASPDTFAAADWLTDPGRARELVRRLRSAKGEMPRYFQVVLTVSFKQGIPVQSSYLFHHVLSDGAPPICAAPEPEGCTTFRTAVLAAGSHHGSSR